MTMDDINGGVSPIADSANDEWPICPKVFMEVFGWVLYNNGLVMNYPVMLN